MKSYKDFEKIYIGCSDIGSLIARGSHMVGEIFFASDGRYEAYECFGEVEIPQHYNLVYAGRTWLKLYDDEGLTYSRWKPNCYIKFDIYRAGDFGCIIYWHN